MRKKQIIEIVTKNFGMCLEDNWAITGRYMPTKIIRQIQNLADDDEVEAETLFEWYVKYPFYFEGLEKPYLKETGIKMNKLVAEYYASK